MVGTWVAEIGLSGLKAGLFERTFHVKHADSATRFVVSRETSVVAAYNRGLLFNPFLFQEPQHVVPDPL